MQSSTTTTKSRYYRATFPFTAPADGQQQLSFAAGDLLVVPDPEQQQNGWIWASHCDNGNRGTCHPNGGWVPLSYLVPEQQQQQVRPTWVHDTNTAPVAFSSPATTSTTNPFDDTYGNDADGNGFGGTAMGGEWTSSKDLPNDIAPAWSHSPNRHQSPRSGPTRGLGGRLGSGLKGVGSSLQQFGKQAGSSVSSLGQKTASACQNAAVETKFRIDDMRQQQQKQQQQPPQSHGNGSTVAQAPQPTATRTRGEQVQLNAANGAVRGAVFGGAVGFVLSGGNVGAAAHSAKVHGVYGGAHGAVQGWKPFG